MAFHTDIVIIGGSYAGLSALVALKNHFHQRQPAEKVSVTLVEPKAGLLNVLGVPRAIVDPEFAKTQYIPFQQLQDVVFDKVISDDEEVQKSLGQTVQPDNNSYIHITYVQGSVRDLGKKSATYTLNGSPEKSEKLTFGRCVIAAGRNRTWPTSPDAFNQKSYMEEMQKFHETVQKCQKIVVVGAGAVGVEIAGDIKSKNKDKEVILVHPHASFPPEPLTEEFKAAVRDSLERSGVEVLTGVRVTGETVAGETGSHELELSNGTTLKADFVYWCNRLWNNTELLGQELRPYVSPKNNVYVNQYLQLRHPDTNDILDNVFCLGDMVELPIIKSAGWALYMGRQVANNLVSLHMDGQLVEALPDISQMPRGMVLVAGNNEIVSELMGEVELNHKGYVEEYRDYCVGKIRVTLGC